MSTQESCTFSRRTLIAGASLWALGGTPPLAGEDIGIVKMMFREAEHAGVEVRQLRRGISVLYGPGGNNAVLQEKDGTLLVDAGFAASRRRISECLESLNAGPIRQLVNTHWHFDHTDGNLWVHEAGGQIVAHAKTRKYLQAATRVEGWNYTFPAVASGALPTQVFTTGMTIHFGGTRVELDSLMAAHTDSDISVHFAEADILHVGDTWWNGFYPFIDYSTGGNINGMIQATERNLAVVSDTTIIIPGHGPVGNKAQLAEYRDMLATIRDNVSGLKKKGRSLEATIAAKPTSAFDEKWGQFLMTPDVFTGLVYAGV